MKQKKFIWLAFLCALTLSLFAWPARTHACSCAPPNPPATAVARADAVFAGTVIRVADASLINQLQHWFNWASGPTYYSAQYTFAVQSSWKGVATTEATLLASGSMCAAFFALNQSYLVYAYQAPDGKLSSGICDRTSILNSNSVAPDLAYLATQPTLTLTPASPTFMPWLGLCAGALVVVLSMGGGVWVFRRARRKP